MSSDTRRLVNDEILALVGSVAGRSSSDGPQRNPAPETGFAGPSDVRAGIFKNYDRHAGLPATTVEEPPYHPGFNAFVARLTNGVSQPFLETLFKNGAFSVEAERANGTWEFKKRAGDHLKWSGPYSRTVASPPTRA